MGNGDARRGVEGRGQVLMSHDVSSLVMDSLCDWAGGQNVAIVCFCFDFSARKGQPPVSMLSHKAYICTDTLLVGERMAAHRVKLLNSLIWGL